MSFLSAVADQLEAVQDLSDPVDWVRDRAGEALWSKQAEVMRALVDHRKVAVRSAHATGKSHLASRVVGWWLDSYAAGDGFVVTTAPTFAQVRAILWRYVRQLHRKAILPGRVNQTEWHINDELVAFGRKPADHDEAAFQGIHAGRVLAVIDEACGVPEQLWVAVDSITTGENDRILAIGNPDNPSSHFAAVCNPANRASTGWHAIGISAFDTPNFTGEEVPDGLKYLLVSKPWVDEKRVEWGEDSPIYVSKVLGQFPPDDPSGIIRPSDVAKCRVGTEAPRVEDLLVELGVDVGGGGDETVIRERRGPHAGREWRQRSDRAEDLAPLILHAIRETGASSVKIDRIGVGHGVVGELKNMAAGGLHSARIIGVNVAEKASDPITFANLRAEIWWLGRTLSESRGWDLSAMDNDDTTCAQLLAPRYKLDNKGRILVEAKQDVIDRLGRSPDNADALLLAFYSPKGDLTQFFERAVSAGSVYSNSRRFASMPSASSSSRA